MKDKIEVTIIPLNQDNIGSRITASILYKNHQIGIFQLEKTEFPPISDAFGAPFNTEYKYTLIFDKKNDLPAESQLNIALDSIVTTGFYKINGGIFLVTDLGLPLGIYKNIGETPQGTKYNLVFDNKDLEGKILIDKLC
jgi:hypothetical protein